MIPVSKRCGRSPTFWGIVSFLILLADARPSASALHADESSVPMPRHPSGPWKPHHGTYLSSKVTFTPQT